MQEGHARIATGRLTTKCRGKSVAKALHIGGVNGVEVSHMGSAEFRMVIET